MILTEIQMKFYLFEWMLLVNKFTEYLGLFIYFSDYVPIANDGLVCSGQDGW